MIMSFLIMLYQYAIVPVLLGCLWIKRGEQASFTKIYLRGYGMMFTLFWIVAVPMVRIGEKLTVLADVWNIVTLAVIPVFIVAVVIKRRRARRVVKDLWKNIKVSQKSLGILMSALVVATLFSMVIVLPSREDDTTEIVAIAVETDEMYRYAAYTRMPNESLPEEKATSPIDMLYAVGVINTGMKPAVMIHVFLPLFLLPLFYSVSWLVGRYLFGSNLQKCSMFVVMILLFSSASCYTKGFLAIGALQNIWNSTTLLASCAIPAVMIQSFSLLDAVERQQRIWKREILLLEVLIIASELLLAKGALLAVLVILSCVGIYIIRRSMQYGKCTHKHKGQLD